MTVSERATSDDARKGDEDVIIEVSNLSVNFDMERGQSRVLDDVSMEIQRGELLGVVGESGSGKSMFASALLNAVVEPGVTDGEITYYPHDGEPVNILELTSSELREVRWTDISMVFQGAMSSFNPTMKVKDHFEETIHAHSESYSERMEHARQLLTDLHLDPDRVLNSFPHELSGGMKQRALIALSLLLEPEVLVMDEPTAALDLLMQRSILSLLENLQEKYDLTIVFITHDLPLVPTLADRLAVMYAFKFVEVGPSEEIVRDATHPYTRALLRSVPSIDTPLNEMQPIEGSAPDPVNVPKGCSYHPRCPLADEQCRSEDPSYEFVERHEESTHKTRCFHWSDAADAVPYTLETGSKERLSAPAKGLERGRGDPLVSLTDVGVEFTNTGFLDSLFRREQDGVRAVDSVSLDIYENDVVALVGESGCGKTTLGKTAIGLHRPTEGTVTYKGQDVWEARDGAGDPTFEEIRRALQIVHQDPGSSLNRNRTVLASLEDPLKQRRPGLGADEREAMIYNLLDRIGMSPASDYATRFPHQLSGGEKQRVVLGRALLMSPDLILADEAVSALDVSLRVEMMDLMLELQDIVNTSYLFISHDLSNARYLAENAGGRIGVMYLGRLVEIGPAEQIIDNPQHPYTKILAGATPSLDPDIAAEERAERPPIRTIDIPDPRDPPSGCRFHTRCPEAREVCTQEDPELFETENGVEASCFRMDDDHAYWDSESIGDDHL